MILWVEFDQKLKKQINEEDIIFTNIGCLHSGNRVIKFDDSFCTGDDRPAKNVAEMFNRFVHDGTFEFYANMAYTQVFKPAISVIMQLENVVNDNNVDTIVLSGGSEHVFLTGNNGEGEGAKKFYKSKWLLNPFIYQYFKDNSKLKIVWKQKGNKYLFKCFNYIREYLFFLKGVVSQGLKNNKDRQIISNKYEKKKCILVPIELKLQYIHLRKLMAEIQDYIMVYLVPAHVKIKDCEDAVENVNNLGLNAVIKIAYNIWRGFGLENKGSLRWGNQDIVFSLKLLKMAFGSRELFDLVRIQGISNICSRIPSAKYLVTDMAPGSYLSLCYKFARENGMIHYNFQYVSMQRTLYPILELSQKFFLYSRSVYSLYCKYCENYALYMPKYDKCIETKKSKLIITFFLQPDQFADRYIQMLQKFFNDTNIFVDYEARIKPHYRQNKMDVFHQISNKYGVRIIEKESNVDSIIKESDVVVSIHSSILFEAVTYGTMGIILDIDGIEKDFIFANDMCVQDVNFYTTSVKEVEDVINRFGEYSQKYVARREQFYKNTNFDIKSLFDIPKSK